MSSELSEIRAALTEIRDATTATATDVAWIKDGMRDAATVTADHGKRLHAVESRMNWLSGAAAVVGSIIGGVVTYFSKHS